RRNGSGHFLDHHDGDYIHILDLWLAWRQALSRRGRAGCHLGRWQLRRLWRRRRFRWRRFWRRGRQLRRRRRIGGMVMKKVNQLSEADHKLVTEAVGEAERATDGEIVTIVTDISDKYYDAGLQWAI